MGIQARKSFLINILFVSVIGFLIFIFGKFLFSYLMPFVLAAFIAWIVQKPADFISRKTKLKSSITAPILAALLYFFVAAAVFYIIYRISLALGDVLNSLPAFTDTLINLISGLEKKVNSVLCDISPDLSKQLSLFGTDMLNNLRTKVSELFSSFAAVTAKRMPSFLFSSIVTLVASCFIAKDFKGLAKFLSLLCGKKVYENILKIKNILCTSVLNIVKGYLWLMVLTFSELTVFLLLLGIKYAPLWALVIALIDLLPVLGTGAVLIPWTIIEFLFDNSKMGISLLVIYLIITLVRNFAEPKIIGDKIGINPLFTLLAMFVGIKVFGFAGLIILPVSLIVIIKYYKNEMKENRI